MNVINSVADWDNDEYEEFPYAHFLNDFESCGRERIDELILHIKNSYKKSTSSTDKELCSSWTSEWVNNVSNIYERHCLRSILSEYVASCNHPDEPPDKKGRTLNIARQWFFPDDFPLMDIFAAYDLTPSHKITQARKKEILDDVEWGNREDETISNRLWDTPIPVIKYFIFDMQKNRLYLNRCKKCGKLFVRRDMRVSALCEGSYCALYPDENSMQRYYQKNELFPYKKEKRKLDNYLARMKGEGSLSEEFVTQTRNESNAKKKRVELGQFQEDKYIKWLRDKHQECIELAAKSRKNNKRKDDGDAEETNA